MPKAMKRHKILIDFCFQVPLSEQKEKYGSHFLGRAWEQDYIGKCSL